MSVIVVGMKMPTCCVLCPLWNHEFGFCNFCGEASRYYNEDGEIYDTFEERYKDCPLREIKDGT